MLEHNTIGESDPFLRNVTIWILWLKQLSLASWWVNAILNATDCPAEDDSSSTAEHPTWGMLSPEQVSNCAGANKNILYTALSENDVLQISPETPVSETAIVEQNA